jgi:hypothetical protein
MWMVSSSGSSTIGRLSSAMAGYDIAIEAINTRDRDS